LQALLISAVMLAPAWGQIHKTIHGLKSNVASEQSLFSEHAEGSVVCQALDHLGSGDTAQTLAHSFSARAPPAFL
jgi:hypothetical protein